MAERSHGKALRGTVLERHGATKQSVGMERRGKVWEKNCVATRRNSSVPQWQSSAPNSGGGDKQRAALERRREDQLRHITAMLGL